MKKFINRFAFTLAEILIVMSIIGMIAEMTIPTLIASVQESIWKNSARAAYSKCSQALEQMRQYEGGVLVSTGNGEFKPAFMKYFKVIKDFEMDKYVPITSGSVAPNIYKTLTRGHAYANWADDGQFLTADGMFFGFDNYGGPILITVDVNFDKKPNVYGKDTFVFQIVNDNLLPMGAIGTRLTAPTNCNRTTEQQFQGFGCMYYVMQGIDY